MKHNLKYVISLVFMLLLTQGAWADPTVSIIKKLNGATVTTTSPGEVADPVIADGKCTLTVTPAEGNYVTKDFITAYSVVKGDVAQTPRRSPDLDNEPIEVRNAGENTDPSSVTTYEFTMPADGSDVEVTVDFQNLIAIEPAVTLEGWTYGSAPNEPVVEGNTGNGALTFTYATKGGTSFSATVPTDVGNYTVKASVAASGKYAAGEATADFTISKATITEVTLENPSLTYTGEEQTVTIASVKAGDLVLTTDDYDVSNDKATAKGSYELTVTAKENSNFTGSKTATFSIGAANIAELYDISLAETSYVYDGTEHKPAVIFKEDNEPVELSTDDYEVSYANNVNVGSAEATTGAPTVTVTGKGNLTGSKTLTFSITAVSLEGAEVTVDATKTYTYTGEEVTPSVAVSLYLNDVKTTLTTDDYTVSYTNNINAALSSDDLAPTVTVTGKGNYTGIASATFTIGKADATITTAPTAKDLTYTGEAQALVEAGTVSAGTMVYSTTLTGTFSETIPTGTNAVTYTVYYKVNGNDNYNGIDASETNKVAVAINPKTLTADMVTVSPESVEYNGATQKPEVTVADGTALTAGDYTIENNGGMEVGKYDVVVTAKGNYTGVVTKQFEIVNRTLVVGADGDVQFAAGQTWASFYTTTESLNLPEGLMAYIVTAVNTTSATLQAINYVPKNVPVLLENESTMTTTNTSADGNLLQGTSAATAVSGIAGTVYALHNNKLMQVTTGSIPVGRAYLVVSSAGAPQLSMIIDGGGTTAIDSLEREAENDGDEWFTLDGRKLQQKPAKKGLYIMNGKKVVVK